MVVEVSVYLTIYLAPLFIEFLYRLHYIKLIISECDLRSIYCNTHLVVLSYSVTRLKYELTLRYGVRRVTPEITYFPSFF